MSHRHSHDTSKRLSDSTSPVPSSPSPALPVPAYILHGTDCYGHTTWIRCVLDAMIRRVPRCSGVASSGAAGQSLRCACSTLRPITTTHHSSPRPNSDRHARQTSDLVHLRDVCLPTSAHSEVEKAVVQQALHEGQQPQPRRQTVGKPHVTSRAGIAESQAALQWWWQRGGTRGEHYTHKPQGRYTRGPKFT